MHGPCYVISGGRCFDRRIDGIIMSSSAIELYNLIRCTFTFHSSDLRDMKARGARVVTHFDVRFRMRKFFTEDVHAMRKPTWRAGGKETSHPRLNIVAVRVESYGWAVVFLFPSNPGQANCTRGRAHTL